MVKQKPAKPTKLFAFVVGSIFAFLIFGEFASKLFADNTTIKTVPAALKEAFTAPDSNGLRKFKDSGSNYTLNYPANWEYEVADKGVVVFNGKKGTSSFYSTIIIQSTSPSTLGGKEKTASEVMNDLKKRSATLSNVEYLHNGDYSITQADTKKMNGKYTVFTYTNRDESFKQYIIVLPRKDNAGFYIWEYMSPVMQFEADFPVAQQMLSSWVSG